VYCGQEIPDSIKDERRKEEEKRTARVYVCVEEFLTFFFDV